MKKVSMVPFTALLLFLTLLSGGLSRGEMLEEPGICKDRFEMLREDLCSPDACNSLCESKHFERLFSSRCWDSVSCECTHRCPRPPHRA